MVFNQIEHLIKMANDLSQNDQWSLNKLNILSKWPMVFSQIEHFIKMTNEF